VEESEPNIVVSRLSRSVTIAAVTVEVQIYRLEHDSKWTLEVVNELGTATVWDDLFDTEEAALDAFREALEDEGIETFLQASDADTLH
jgi:hypothetical protein